MALRHYAGSVKPLAFCFSAALLLELVYPSVVAAFSGWPSHDSWLQGLLHDGTLLIDPTGDFPGAPGLRHLDLASDTTPGTGAVLAWYFDGDRLFIRIVLRDNPLQNSVRLRNHVWLVYVNTRTPSADEGFHADYAIVLDHSGIRTTYADLSRPVTPNAVNRGTGFSSQSNGHSQGPTVADPYRYIYYHPYFGYMVRVANAAHVSPGGAADRWYLEFFIPLEWLSVPSPGSAGLPPDPVTPDTGVRFALATSTQLNVIHKDEAGLGEDGRFHAGYTVLRSVLPPDPEDEELPSDEGELVFIEPPDDVDVLAPLNRVVVEARDHHGGPVFPEGSKTRVTLKLVSAGDGSVVMTMIADLDAEGRAVFENLVIGRPGVYRMIAVADGFSDATSAPFTVWGSYLADSTYTVTPETPVRRGERLTYRAQVLNTGNRSTENLVLSVVVPAYTSLERSPTDVCSAVRFVSDTRTLECALPALAPGGTVDFSFDVVVHASVADGTELISEAYLSDAWNEVSLPADGPLVTFVRVPDVQVQLNVFANGGVVPGEVLTVAIEVVNRGGAPATDVVVQGPVQEALEFVAGSATGPDGAVVQFQGPDGRWYDVEFADDGTPLKVLGVRWRLPVLEGGSTADFYYRVLVP